MTEDLVKVLPLVVSLLACTVNSATAEFGKDRFRCESTENCFPFNALLMNVDVICTAAILSPSWMVSSSSCYTKKSGWMFLAYAGSGDLTAAEQLQVRCAEAVVWADPATGFVTQEATEQSRVALLLTNEPWSSTEAVHPVFIGEAELSPSALQDGNCFTAGFDHGKILTVAFCDADVQWKEDGQVCFNSDTSGTFAEAPGSLLYCYGPPMLIGVGLGHSDVTPNTWNDSITTQGSCFAYLGGTLLTSLQEIADNDYITNDLRRHFHSNMNSFIPANRAATLVHTKSNLTPDTVNENQKDVEKSWWPGYEDLDFEDAQIEEMSVLTPGNRTATQVHTKSNLNHGAVNENQEDMGKSSWVVKREFDVGSDQNETDEVEYLTSAHQAPLADAMWWALVAIPVAAVFLLLIFRTAVLKLFFRLYTSLRTKKRSHNYECVL